MTPQERELLESLAARIASTPVPQKDPEAEALIREQIGTRPDALYVLTQTVLIQEMALKQANARLHQLQEQTSQQNPPTSFLSRLFGAGAPSPPPGYAPQYAPPPYQPAPSAGSSFLRSAAATATGVAAGALAFEGIEALLGHHGGFGGYGGGGFLGGAPSETIINNYYDDQSANANYDDSQSGDASSDVSDASYDDYSGSGDSSSDG